MKPSDALQNGSFWHKKMQNLELVNLKCVTYAQPIPLFLKGFYCMNKHQWISFYQLFFQQLNVFLFFVCLFHPQVKEREDERKEEEHN